MNTPPEISQPELATSDEFAQDLDGRMINAQALALEYPTLYADWVADYAVSSPEAFWQRHRFSVNRVRRRLQTMA